MRISLATINARYAHSSLALRCLRANLGPFRAMSRLHEFVSGARTETMAEAILADSPQLLGLSVYIWNVVELTRLVALMKTIAPEMVIVLGGPEVSHESDQQEICRLADYVITGAGELAFARLCSQLAAGRRPLLKMLPGDSLLVEGVELPYEEYTDTDIAHRYIYIEASRGCPFKCEFCLSSLDRTARTFDPDRLIGQLARLHERGARSFKFIDRTFNLKIDDSRRILEFFLTRIEADPLSPLLLHFELIPDHLPETLRELIARFPAGVLQFEIGIQTWNPQTQALISRRQDNNRAQANLTWLREHSHAHLHVDLIAGLPGETIESFASGFDRLIALRPQEIQVGILKRLRGTPIVRHTQTYGYRFNPNPPYNLLASDLISFEQMQGLQRFARYWDLIGNSGHFTTVLPFLLASTTPTPGPSDPTGSAFHQFQRLSEFLYRTTDRTHEFAAERLFGLLAEWIGQSNANPQAALAALASDRQRRFMRRPASPAPDRTSAEPGPAPEPGTRTLRHRINASTDRQN